MKTAAILQAFLNRRIKRDSCQRGLREHIQARFPGVKFVGHEEFGNFHGAREHAVSAAIPDKLRAHGADAVIVGIGA